MSPVKSTTANAPSSERFPDLYELLSLQPLESDQAAIEGALRRLAAVVKSLQLADSRDPSAARSAKIFELGKRHLLSVERKQAYDRKWQQVFLGSELLQLLPAGDPDEPFRLADFAESSLVDAQFGNAQVDNAHGDYNADFQKLKALIGTVQPSLPTANENALVKAQVDNAAQPVASAPSLSVDASPAPFLSKPPLATAPQKFSAGRQQRKRRERGMLWGTIGGLAGLGGLLGLYFWMVKPDDTGIANSLQAVAPKQAVTAGSSSISDGEQVEPAVVRRSGLPSVQGITAEQNLTENIDALVPVAPEPQKSLNEAGESEPMMPVTPMDEPAAMEMVDPEAPLSEEEQSAWMVAMTDARRLIGEQHYAEANEKLADSERLAKSSVHKAQLQRLTKVNQLAEELLQGMRSAIKDLGAGEVITIGSSTAVSIVDSDEDSLTIRMRGENRTFALPDLPIGLAFALSDFSLAADAPNTQARKAAFALVHPGAAGNDLVSQRAQQMLAAAAAAGVVEEDLLLVFSDDYQGGVKSD